MKACIDIGGTKVAVSLNSGSDRALHARRSEATAVTGDNDALARQVVRLVDEACAEMGLDHCAYITWSTGVGVGLCVDGRPLRGKNGNAGHAGHMFVSDDEEALCGCGNIGDVEALVSGNAIERRFGNPAAQLLGRADAGEPDAIAAVDELCRVLGRALYNLVATLDLQRVSIGGGVFWHHRALLLPRLQAQLAGRLPALTAGCELVPAGLGDAVGDYAALALVS